MALTLLVGIVLLDDSFFNNSQTNIHLFKVTKETPEKAVKYVQS